MNRYRCKNAITQDGGDSIALGLVFQRTKIL